MACRAARLLRRLPQSCIAQLRETPVRGSSSSIERPWESSRTCVRNLSVVSHRRACEDLGEILDRPAASCESHVRSNGSPSVQFYRTFVARSKKFQGSYVEDVPVAEAAPFSPKHEASSLMHPSLSHLAKELAKVRTGRITATMLDHITVSIGSSSHSLPHVAAVSVSGLQTLSVVPFDPSTVASVEKALRSSPLGLGVSAEGSALSVSVPRLTKETRQAMTKVVSKAAEDAKLSIRRARKEVTNRVKAAGWPKDEVKRQEKEVDGMTKQFEKTVDTMCEQKYTEIELN